MKIKRIVFVTVVLVSCLFISIGSSVLANYVWTGDVIIPNPLALPPSTLTFSVSASLNGTAVADPTHIVIPDGFYEGDTFVVTYDITSTADQGIVVTASFAESNGIAASWGQGSVTTVTLLQSGDSESLTLTISNIQVSGAINLGFTATPIA